MSDPNLKQVLDEVRRISEKQASGLLTADERKTLEGLHDVLDKQEEKNQQLTADLQKRIEAEEEFKNRITDLEDQLINGRDGQGVDFKNSDAYKALQELCVKGEHILYSEYKDSNLLRTDSEVSGGVLTTTEMAGELIKPITEISPIRQYARVRTINSKSLMMPIRTGLLDAQWEGEAEEDDESTSKYGSETVTPFRLTTTVPVTMDMLMDSAFDMNSEIMMDANESFAKKEGIAFVKGTGKKQPMGFTVDPRVVKDAMLSAGSGAINGDDVIKLSGELKAGYNDVMTFNRKTLVYLRTLKSSDGKYLWQPGLNGQVANNIAGTPYFLCPDMPDIAANSIPIAVGDWRRGYQIIDRTALSIVRDDYSRKKQAIVEFTLHRWLTGSVTLPEAIKLLRVKA